jgi:hypothetical protein
VAGATGFAGVAATGFEGAVVGFAAGGGVVAVFGLGAGLVGFTEGVAGFAGAALAAGGVASGFAAGVTGAGLGFPTSAARRPVWRRWEPRMHKMRMKGWTERIMRS